jgi:outer membrane protein OmpA-like peptidoglycan-associated protein
MRVDKMAKLKIAAAVASGFALIFSGLTPLAANAVTESVSGTTRVLTYNDPSTLETLEVPANVTQMTITIVGGEGGRGGNDSNGRPAPGGYKGVVSGTVPVTPGNLVSVAVGGGGLDSVVAPNCSAGVNATSGDTRVALGGTNILAGYDGGDGGAPGPDGCSGYGGSGGAASVVQIGTSAAPASIATLVAGGSGGSGGSGQYASLIGKLSLNFFAARVDGTTVSSGENGLYTKARCIEVFMGRCDGGGGAGGGGGSVGGARGGLEFGAGNDTEWFGMGGHPGANDTAGISTLSASYDFYSANNNAGSVVISFASGIPAQPTGLSGSPNNGLVDLYWSAPTNTGTSALTGYTVQYAESPYSSWTTATSCTGVSTSCSVTGLTNGTPYKFRVAATNGSGSGSYSAISDALTPSGAPAEPTNIAITPGDGRLSVAFTAPSSPIAITNYQYSLDGNAWVSADVTASPAVISGLLNGRLYSVSLRAVSAAGIGSASTPVNGTPSALPGAPTITSVTAGSDGTSLIVAFVAGYNGGSTITDYEFATSIGENTSNFGNYTPIAGTASTASPFTITGLTTGTAYTVTLRAKNSAGVGPGSPFLTGVTLGAPSKPVISGIVVGDSKLTITYVDYTSANNGGSAISKVEYSYDGNNWADAGTLTNPYTISGLTNGTTYSIKLRATNAIGTSLVSDTYSATPISKPGSPSRIQVAVAPGAATVSWLAPATDGGGAITGYTASAYNVATGGSAAASCSTTTALTCEITGLTNGTTYFFAVTATNSVGTGVASSPRVSAAPSAPPAAPTNLSITAGSNYLSVAFTAAVADANAPVLSYQYSLNGGTSWVTSAAASSPVIISGLTNGTVYPVTLRATSAVGFGAVSSSVNGTPVSAPDVVDPTRISYVAASGSATVTWVAPNANGLTINEYVVTAFTELLAGGAASTCTTSGAVSCQLTGLNNGTTYYVSIQSKNSLGYSLRSAPRVPVRAGNASEVALASSANTVSVGSSVTLTATVTSATAGTPGGTVSFSSGGTAITGCSAVAVTAGGTATCVTSALLARTHSIQASYSGDSTYSSSASAAASVVVQPISQTVTFGALGNKFTSDASFALAATGGASGNPVIFSSDTPSVCSTSGTHGSTVNILGAGSCTIRASQAGTPNYGQASDVLRTFSVREQFTIQYSGNRAAQSFANAQYADGDDALVLPTPTRASYKFMGWYDAATAGNLIGAAGASYRPAASKTLHARWLQLSLANMGNSNTKIGSITTVSGVGNTYTASGSGSQVVISYQADALPTSTVIDLYLTGDATRAQQVLGINSGVVVSMVVAWVASDETVPTTAAGKSLTMTINNPSIQTGAIIYGVLGDNVVRLGTATQNGTVTIFITEDPEIYVANPAPIVVTLDPGPVTQPTTPTTPETKPEVPTVPTVPVVVAPVAKQLLKLLTIKFVSGQVRLTAAAKTALQKVKKLLNGATSIAITSAGVAAKTKSSKAALAVAKARAMVVVSYLRSLKVKAKYVTQAKVAKANTSASRVTNLRISYRP